MYRGKYTFFTGRLVGKCLYESAHGSSYRLHLPARLAKSFLAQLVGLRVSYRHFAQDAPQLYTSKIQYLETVASPEEIEALDMTFTDEERVVATSGATGPAAQVRTVELVPCGAKVSLFLRSPPAQCSDSLSS